MSKIIWSKLLIKIKKHAKIWRISPEKVKRAIHEYKRGELKNGKSHKKVTSRKQAIAIGLSEARARGGKVPRKKS